MYLLDSIAVTFEDQSALQMARIVLDIGLVAAVVYIGLSIFRGTRAARIGIGLGAFAVLAIVGRLLSLETFSWLMSHAATAILVAVPVVFQPELRRFFERVGRSGSRWRSQTRLKHQYDDMLHVLVPVLEYLSSQRIGALLVIQRTTGLVDLEESGTRLDAHISKSLLLSLFCKESPLHDGAVVLTHQRIVAAGVLLPLSDQELPGTYGTRHRAALGVTEASDAVAVVVSEERGHVSVASDGALTPIAIPQLKASLLAALTSREAS